jgi:hypothetical protein
VYDFEAANKYKRELDDTTFGSPEKAREWFYEKVYARPTHWCKRICWPDLPRLID